MHELGFAEAVVECVLREAEKHCAKRIQRLHLKVGTYLGIEKASLAFCIEALAAETPLASAKLEICDDPPIWHCPRCEIRNADPDNAYDLFVERCCPQCGGLLIPTGGTEITVVEIDIDDHHSPD
jgi:hydrogenase nickel incorporation protein HypA/HybF